jgi:hypothetical protein
MQPLTARMLSNDASDTFRSSKECPQLALNVDFERSLRLSQSGVKQTYRGLRQSVENDP